MTTSLLSCFATLDASAYRLLLLPREGDCTPCRGHSRTYVARFLFWKLSQAKSAPLIQVAQNLFFNWLKEESKREPQNVFLEWPRHGVESALKTDAITKCHVKTAASGNKWLRLGQMQTSPTIGSPSFLSSQAYPSQNLYTIAELLGSHAQVGRQICSFTLCVVDSARLGNFYPLLIRNAENDLVYENDV